jgi:hypothetical protein
METPSGVFIAIAEKTRLEFERGACASAARF